MLEIRLFATFREGREKVLIMDWYEGMDGYALVDKLGIPPEEVAIYLINGFHNKLDAKLNAHDIIALFPPVGGG